MSDPKDLGKGIQDAFNEVDKTSRKIDKLKSRLASNTRETARVRAAVQEELALRSDPKNDPRREPEEERPKRPSERPVRQSGRFFLQFARAADPEELRQVRDLVTAVGGKVVDSGTGTVGDPDAGWLEVSVKGDDPAVLTRKLERKAEIIERLQKAILVMPGEGRDLAKQMDLFELDTLRPPEK